MRIWDHKEKDKTQYKINEFKKVLKEVISYESKAVITYSRWCDLESRVTHDYNQKMERIASGKREAEENLKKSSALRKRIDNDIVELENRK